MSKYEVTIKGTNGTTSFSLQSYGYPGVWKFLNENGWQLPYVGYILEINVKEVY